MFYNSFPEFHVRQEEFSFYGARKSDKVVVTNLIKFLLALPFETKNNIMKEYCFRYQTKL